MGDPRARHRRQRDVEDPAAVLRRLGPAPRAPGWVPSPPAGSLPPRSDDADGKRYPFHPTGRDAHPADREGVPRRTVPTVRWAPSARALAGLSLLVAAAVVVAAVALWLARPREEPVPVRSSPVGAPVDAGGGPAPAGSAAPLAPGAGGSGSEAGAGPPLLVHVVGAVREPGVVELPAGSRVADAVDAAGGLTARAAAGSVNLARHLVDGEQLVVLRHGEATGAGALPPPAPGGGAPAAGTPVDLNSATLEQLDSLPGIGPVLAQRILDWRTANGRFTSVDELGEVSGIGEATLADLRNAVRV